MVCPVRYISIREGQERLLIRYRCSMSMHPCFVVLLHATYREDAKYKPTAFNLSRWWEEVSSSRATIVHYLGVISAATQAT